MRSLAIAQPSMLRAIFMSFGVTNTTSVGSVSPEGVLPICSFLG
jgi:hypothetical protein